MWNLVLCDVVVGQSGQRGAFDNFNNPRGATQTDEDNQLPGERPVLEREDLKPQQPIVVREDRAGWNEAGKGISRERLSEQLRSHWVMVDSNGLLLGTVIGFNDTAVTDVKVHLLSNGIVVSTANVNAQGRFRSIMFRRVPMDWSVSAKLRFLPLVLMRSAIRITRLPRPLARLR